MPDPAPVARGVYKPRRPQTSPLLRLVSDHLQRLQTVFDERFAREYGPWRPVYLCLALGPCSQISGSETRSRAVPCRA
jgi:hypothetical protein